MELSIGFNKVEVFVTILIRAFLVVLESKLYWNPFKRE